MELELGEGFAGAEMEIGEGYVAVGGGPFGGCGLRGGRGCHGRVCCGHGHGLAVGGGGEKESGGDGDLGDAWGHLGSGSLRIEDSCLFGIRKGPKDAGVECDHAG